MYQIDGGPYNMDASAVVMRNQNSGAFLCHMFPSHLTSDKSFNLCILLPQRDAMRVTLLVFPGVFRYCTDGLHRWIERESRHTFINLVKDWYLTQQCSQTNVKGYIISKSLISGILFCAVLLYLLVCGLFCSFLEERTWKTWTENAW